MARRAAPPGPPPETKAIHFEAALAPVGNCFTMTAEGDARLVLTVPASAARPLAEAMARRELGERVFVVAITWPADKAAKG